MWFLHHVILALEFYLMKTCFCSPSFYNTENQMIWFKDQRNDSILLRDWRACALETASISSLTRNTTHFSEQVFKNSESKSLFSSILFSWQ